MKLSFYTADALYCDFLHETDKCVPLVAGGKERRPFVGILLLIGGFEYYAPLTSPKAKHLTMKNQVDFLKINGGEWGAINLNNMIPIHSKSLTKVDLHILPQDDKAVVEYKNLLVNQLSWCNSNREIICAKASKLHSLIAGERANDLLKRRCCDFSEDEKRCYLYCAIHGLT